MYCTVVSVRLCDLSLVPAIIWSCLIIILPQKSALIQFEAIALFPCAAVSSYCNTGANVAGSREALETRMGTNKRRALGDLYGV